MKISISALRLISQYSLYSKTELAVKPCIQFFNLHTNLLHGVALTDRDASVRLGIKVICDAVRSSDLIFSSVTLADRSSVILFAVVLLGELRIDLLRRF